MRLSPRRNRGIAATARKQGRKRAGMHRAVASDRHFIPLINHETEPRKRVSGASMFATRACMRRHREWRAMAHALRGFEYTRHRIRIHDIPVSAIVADAIIIPRDSVVTNDILRSLQDENRIDRQRKKRPSLRA